MPNNPFQNLPQDWEVKTLGNLGIFIRGVSYKKEQLLNIKSSDSVYLLRANNIQENLKLDDLQIVPREIAENKIIQDNDILFAMSSGSKHIVGKNIIVNNLIDYSFGTFCGVFRSTDKNLIPLFLSFYLKSDSYKKYTVTCAKGTNINNLKFSDLESLPIPIPPLETQQKIVAKLESEFAKIEAAKNHLEKVKETIPRLKNALLKSAFSGELTESPSCHSEALAEESKKDFALRDISGFALNMTNGGVCHSELECNEREESKFSCHTEPLGEVSRESNRDISLVSQAQYDNVVCHSESPSCHSEGEARRISLGKEPPCNTITLTQNQIAFSKYPAFIYMVSNKNNTTLYVGVTSNLQKRIYEHKNHLHKGFSDKYNCEKLVYFETFDNINQAIEREKYLKGKKRAFKENLINAINPKWLDLYDYLFSCHSELGHSENEESSQNRDISHFSNAQYDKPTCHSEALAEESQKDSTLRDISGFALNMTNGGICHFDLERSEREESKFSCHTEPLGEVSQESNRDISLVSQAQYDKKDNLPQGWEVKTLGGITNYGKTTQKQPKDLEPDDWILELEDIKKESGVLLNKITFKDRQSKSNKIMFHKGDVLFGTLRPYLKKVIIADDDGYCSSEIMPFNSGNEITNHYLVYLFLSDFMGNKIAMLTYGTRMPRLGTKNGKELPIPLPPLQTQKQIVEILDSKFATLENLEKETNASLEKLQKLKSSLLNQAFKGELIC